jgi:hypothetical protein
MRRLNALASVLVALILPLASTSKAQSIADRLPEGTLIYLESVGHKNVSTFAPSHAGQLLLSPEMQKLHAAVIPTLLKLAEKEGDEEAINAIKLLGQLLPALLQDGGAIYLSSLDVTGPRAGFVLKAPGQGKPLFDQHPDVFLKAMENDSLRLRQVGDYAVIGIGYPAADAVLPDAPLPEKSLAASPRFKAAFTGFQHDPLFRIYIDIAGLHKAISAIADIPEAEDLRDYPKIAEVLGLASADTLAVSTGVHGKNWRNELFLASTSPRGVLGVLIQPAAGVDTSTLTAIPADATLATLSTLDLAALLEATRGMVDAHAPEYTEQFNSYLGLASQTLGTDIPKEVLPHLGSTWATYRAPSIAGNGVFGTVLLNKLKDPAKASAGIEKLGQGINRTLLSVSQNPFPRFTFRSTTIEGVPVRTLPMALVNLSVAVQGDYLIVGLQPQSAVAAARYISSPDGKPNLASSSGYKQALARIGAPPTAATSYVDLPTFAPTGYQTLIFAANALGAGGTILGADVPVAQLPPFYKVVGAFSPDVSALWADESGLHLRSETPFPGASLVAEDLASMGILQLLGASGMLGAQMR